MLALRSIVLALLLVAAVLPPIAVSAENPGAREFALGQQMFKQGELAAAETHLARAVKLGHDGPRVWLALGKVAVGLRRADLALERFDRAVRLDPTLRSALLERGLLNFRLAEHEQAASDFRRILTLPLVPGRINDLALARRTYAAKVWRGEIHVTFEKALESGLLEVDRAAVLAKLYGRLSAGLARGPGFKHPEKAAGESHIVLAEGSQGAARLVLSTLEAAFKSWRRSLAPWLPEVPAWKGRVLVFASRESFVEFLGGLTGERASARLARAGYIPAIGYIFLVADADLDRFLRTIRHEGVHRFLHSAMPPLPPWLSEGLADYLACARSSSAPLMSSAPHPDRLDALRSMLNQTPPPELRALVEADHDTFMASRDPQLIRRSKVAARNYALAWAFVHFLMEGSDGANAQVIRHILRLRHAGQSLERAITQGFGSATPPSLQQPFLQHANETLLNGD